MKEKEFTKLLNKVFDRTENILLKKRNEYAHKEDVFKSFKNGTGFSLHTEPEQVAWSYLAKHLESIQSIIRKLPNERPSEELINEKFGDAINYLIIIEGLLREK